MDDEFDVFISYSWRPGADGAATETELAEALHGALERIGLRVWRDVDRIRHGEAIHEALEKGIRSSTIVVPLLSAQHQASNICRWELICALAYGRGGDALPVFPITLEGSGIARHYPPGVFDANVISWDGDLAALDSLGGLIHQQVTDVRTSGGTRPEALFKAGMMGAPGVTGHRFVGRLPDILRIYGRLLGGLAAANAVAINHAPLQLLRGAPGMGKSSLAAFFAERFSGRYERGVLWLDSAGDQVDADASSPEAREVALRSLTAGALRWLRALPGPPPKALPKDAASRWDAVRDLVRAQLTDSGGRLLLVVDDVPRGLHLSDLTIGSAATSTLLTSRSDHLVYEGVEDILVDQFEPFESMMVLDNARDPDGTTRRRGMDHWRGQAAEARELTTEVGHHPMAIDLLGLRLLLDGSTQPADLLAEIRAAAPRFIDVADVTLPLEHPGSIVATVAGSLRSAVGRNASRAALLRMLAVAPAGRPVPEAALQHGLAATGRHDLSEALEQLSGYGLLGRRKEANEPEVAQHQMISAVARELWRRSSDPFAAEQVRPREPDLSWALAHWYHAEGERLRNADDVKAADVHGVALHVLAEGEAEGAVGPSQALHRLFGLLAQARVTFRAADMGTLEEYDAALSVIDHAEAAIGPFRGRLDVDFAYWTAEAMRALVRGSRSQYLGSRALEEARAAMDLALAADAARQRIAGPLLAMPPDECLLDHDYIRDVLARSLFNIPGRAIPIVKRLRKDRPVGWDPEARRLLQSGAKIHLEVLEMRRALFVDRLDDKSIMLSLASSEGGIGMMHYYEALLPGRPEARLRLLDRAVAQIGVGLWMRDQAANETDVIKSLALLLKAVLATRWLRSDVDIPAYARQHELACLSAEQPLSDFVGRPYLPETDPPSPAFEKRRAWREALRSDLQRIGSDISGADEALLIGCCTTTIGWLALAKLSGVTKDAYHFAAEFFNEDLEQLADR